MSPRPPKRKSKKDEPKQPPSRFAPSAFLSGSTEAVQQLCDVRHAGNVAAGRAIRLQAVAVEASDLRNDLQVRHLLAHIRVVEPAVALCQTDEQARAVHVDVRGIVEALDRVYKAADLLKELGATPLREGSAPRP